MGSPSGTWGQFTSVPGSPLVINIQQAALGAVAVFDPVTGVLGPSSLIYNDIPSVTTVNLTSAQLLALSTTPVQLVAAPGVGQYIWAIAYVMDYTYGTVAYSSPAHTNQCFITYGNPPAAATNEITLYTWASATTGIIEATQSCLFQGVCGNGLVTRSIAANAPLMFSAPNALTLGNGTLKITLSYVTLQV
jgi:hypothetical protein